eukprot:2911281-Pyramimonas_sp.AAC.1
MATWYATLWGLAVAIYGLMKLLVRLSQPRAQHARPELESGSKAKVTRNVRQPRYRGGLGRARRTMGTLGNHWGSAWSVAIGSSFSFSFSRSVSQQSRSDAADDRVDAAGGARDAGGDQSG